MPELTTSLLSKRLHDAHQALHATIQGLTEEQMSYIFKGTEGWTSVGDILKHLLSGERGMLTVVQRCLAGGEPPSYEGFDLDRYNRRQVEKLQALTPAEAIAQYDTVRRETLAVLDSLTEEQLKIPAGHPIYDCATVGELFRIMGIHEEMHRGDIVKMIRNT